MTFHAYSEYFAQGIVQGLEVSKLLSQALFSKAFIFPFLLLLVIAWGIAYLGYLFPRRGLKAVFDFFIWLVFLSLWTLSTASTDTYRVRVYPLVVGEGRPASFEPLLDIQVEAPAILAFLEPAEELSHAFFSLSYTSEDLSKKVYISTNVYSCLSPWDVLANGFLNYFLMEPDNAITGLRNCYVYVLHGGNPDPLLCGPFFSKWYDYTVSTVKTDCRALLSKLLKFQSKSDMNEWFNLYERSMSAWAYDCLYNEIPSLPGVELCRKVKSDVAEAYRVWEANLLNTEISSVPMDVANDLGYVIGKTLSQYTLQYKVKFAYFLKFSGIITGLFIAVFPIVMFLGIFPRGGRFYHLWFLVSVLFAYFLIKMWVPVVIFVQDFAFNRFIGVMP